ncbi:MAG: hypothetical protein ABW215_23970 [Kibdelosporangium sp.]
MTEQRLDRALVRRLVAGELCVAERAKLAEQVTHAMPFHTAMPDPVVTTLGELVSYLGNEATLLKWLDCFPGRPRTFARLFEFIEVLDRTTTATTAALSARIEALIERDQIEDAIVLALETAGPVTPLTAEFDMARQNLMEVSPVEQNRRCADTATD